MNKSKSVAFLIEGENINLCADNTIGIGWSSKPFKTLGMWFSLYPNETYSLNFTEKVNTIHNILKSSQTRCLTLKEK